MVQTVGAVYRLTGMGRGDGVNGRPLVLDSGATFLFQGTTSTAWQAFDVTFTAVGAACYFFNYAASGYAEFTNLRFEVAPASTRNLGTLGGYAQLGDGYTAASFPTQVFPHGMSFDGATDYLQVDNSSGVFNFTSGGVDQPFSAEVLIRPGVSAGTFLCKGAFTIAPGGWFFYTSGGNPVLLITDAAGNYFYVYVVNGVPTVAFVQHITVVYTGGGITGVSMYIAGAPRAVASAGVGVYGGLPAAFYHCMWEAAALVWLAGLARSTTPPSTPSRFSQEKFRNCTGSASPC